MPASRDSGDRKHQCASCPLSFKRREHYQRHLRSHTKERPFTCRHCSKSFSRKDLVLRHMRKLHSDGREFELGSDKPSESGPLHGNLNVVTPHDNLLTKVSHGRNIWPKPSQAHVYRPTISTKAIPKGLSMSHGLPSIAEAVTKQAFLQTENSSHDRCIELDSGTDARVVRLQQKCLNSPQRTPLLLAQQQPLHLTAPPCESRGINASSQDSAAPKPRIGAHFAVETHISSKTGAFVAAQDFEYHQSNLELIQACLTSYFDTFNTHFPLFHVPTFNCNEEPRHLILIMAAIGAAFRREQETAALLYYSAEAKFSSSKLSSDAADLPNVVSLADARTLLLMVVFGSFNGDRQLASKALGRLKRLLACCESVAKTLKIHTRDHFFNDNIPWERWIKMESQKRLVHGALIFCNLLSVTYSLGPTHLWHEIDVELPSSDRLWHAATTDHWTLQLPMQRSTRLLTIRDAVVLFSQPANDTAALLSSALDWSDFALVVVMHVLSIAIPQVENRDQDKFPFASPSESAVSRAQSLLWSLGLAENSQLDEGGANSAWNASSALRMASVRAHTGFAISDRTSMLKGDVHEALAAVSSYVKEQFPRSQIVAEAIAQAFEGLIVPGSGRMLLVRKSAPLTWSIEQLVTAFDTIVIVTKWLHTIQCVPQEYHERAVVDHISRTLLRNGCPLTSVLATDLCRFWAAFGETFWIWAVSTRMNAVLQSLADAYEQPG